MKRQQKNKMREHPHNNPKIPKKSHPKSSDQKSHLVPKGGHEQGRLVGQSGAIEVGTCKSGDWTITI